MEYKTKKKYLRTENVKYNECFRQFSLTHSNDRSVISNAAVGGKWK